MKTNYRPRSSVSTGRKRLTYVLATLLACAAIFFVFRTSILGSAALLWKGTNRLSQSLSSFVELVRSKESLVAENAALKQELSSYAALVDTLRAASDSRDTLLSVYGRSASSTGIAATVLVHPPETPYDVLILDAGSAEGVRRGDRVFTPEGALLGSVVEVADHASRAALYTSGGLKTDAVLERGLVPVTLIGEGGGDFKLDLPKDTAAVVGDRIIAPGIAGSLMGAVSDIESSPTDSAKHVSIAGPANISSIRYVSIKP